MKICNQCFERKTLDKFIATMKRHDDDTYTRDGLLPCKLCRKEKRKVSDRRWREQVESRRINKTIIPYTYKILKLLDVPYHYLTNHQKYVIMYSQIGAYLPTGPTGQQKLGIP